MNADEQARHWEYRLHEDLMFNERQNLFLIAESVLALAYTEAFSTRVGGIVVEVGIAVMALVLTLAWLHVNRRQRYLIGVVHRIAIAELREYAETYERRQGGGAALGSTIVIAYGVPSLVAVMWLLAIVVAATADAEAALSTGPLTHAGLQ